MSDILDDLDSPWPADYALQPKNSSERFDVIHAQEVKRQAADEIRGLREQVAALEADRDDWIACHAKIFRELQETKTLVGNKCEEVAALAEQNEKMRTALEAVSEFRFPHGDNCYLDPDHAYGNSCLCGKESLESLVAEALSIPDLATPAINRIRAEGMRMAAEICDDYSEKKWHAYKGIDGAAADRACDIVQGESSGAEDCGQAIRARADELYPEVKL